MLAAKLEAIPPGYCVSDASTRALLTDAARILVEQDERIGAMTVALCAARSVLPPDQRGPINELLRHPGK